MSKKGQQELQVLLNKITVFLEASLNQLHVLESCITDEGYLIITYLLGKSGNEDAIYFAPNEWPRLSFFDLARETLNKIEDQLPSPRSVETH